MTWTSGVLKHITNNVHTEKPNVFKMLGIVIVTERMDDNTFGTINVEHPKQIVTQ